MPLAFAAMAQSVIIIGGGVDLSIGAQIGLMNAIAARSMDGGASATRSSSRSG